MSNPKILTKLYLQRLLYRHKSQNWYLFLFFVLSFIDKSQNWGDNRLMDTKTGISIKIKKVTVSRKGQSGLVITLPKVWADDLSISAGDSLGIYRTEDDRLIIQKEQK